MRTRLLPILSLLLIALMLLGACAVPGAQSVSSTDQTAVEGYAHPEVLVDTAWILEHVNDQNVRLIDVSSNSDVFAAGHLPGAQFVDWQADLTNPDDPVRGQVLTRDALSALFSRLGVANDDTLVLYDDTNNLFAARAYWVLRYYQHHDVRVYNGGSKKWTADGQQLTTEVEPASASQYLAGEPDSSIRTDWQYVVDHVGDSGTLFCDVRGPKEYAGTDVRSARGGHVPSAINVEWTNAVNQDGTFRAASELGELYRKAGFTPDKEIITYCQTGVRGAHTWFVLRELLGYPNVRNYDGSWEDYGNQAESPIEQ
jgi:thiosulfate/3-mercaptopyruvate sulfurtransferase